MEETDFNIEIGKRDIVCHRCETKIPKGVIKVKADFGRRSRGGHIWWYQLCIPCARKKLQEKEKKIYTMLETLNREEKNHKLKMQKEADKKWLN